MREGGIEYYHAFPFLALLASRRECCYFVVCFAVVVVVFMVWTLVIFCCCGCLYHGSAPKKQKKGGKHFNECQCLHVSTNFEFQPRSKIWNLTNPFSHLFFAHHTIIINHPTVQYVHRHHFRNANLMKLYSVCETDKSIFYNSSLLFVTLLYYIQV